MGTIKFEQDQNLSGRRSTLTAHSLKKKKACEKQSKKSTSEQQIKFTVGDFILVKFLVRNKEYRSVAICSHVKENEEKLNITLLKKCNNKNALF